MESWATIAYVLVGSLIVSSTKAVAEDCPEVWQMECGNGACYTGDNWCDKTDDCGNSKDEQGCSNDDLYRCMQLPCFFTCYDRTRCIVNKWICDGRNDCQDGSDEKNCPEAREAAWSVLCAFMVRRPSRNLHRHRRGAVTAEVTSKTSTSPSDCNVDDGDFPCLDGRCLLPVQVCDGVKDCSDGADEGRFCQVVCRGNQRPQQQHGLRGWLVDLRIELRVFPESLRNTSNLTRKNLSLG